MVEYKVDLNSFDGCIYCHTIYGIENMIVLYYATEYEAKGSNVIKITKKKTKPKKLWKTFTLKRKQRFHKINISWAQANKKKHQ